jgi:hypothetical protein
MTETLGDKFLNFFANIGKDFKEKITKLSSDTIHWMAVLCLHAATAPNLLGLMFGLTDTMPPIDIVLIVWAGLALLFMKAIIMKDRLNLITIGVGFMAQAVVMALIFFK